LRGPVQTGAANRTDPLRQRGDEGALGGFGDGAFDVELGVTAAAHIRHEHAQQRDEGDGEQVGVAGVVQMEDPGVLQGDDEGPEQGGGRGPVGQHGQRRDGTQQEADVERLGADQGGDHQGHQQYEGQHPYPLRGRRAAQPAPPVPLSFAEPPYGTHASHTPTLLREAVRRTSAPALVIRAIALVRRGWRRTPTSARRRAAQRESTGLETRRARGVHSCPPDAYRSAVRHMVGWAGTEE